MDSETVETVTEWEVTPFAGGYGGLHELADREFTGAVTDGMAWLFLLNGRVVGVVDGSIESFADADGTAYAAPDPSLPLLFAMRERGGEPRAKYYTNDTPLSAADATLSSGNFTGYVELTENVLSGDYYVVYYGGRSLACAFVGNQPRTITGEEAFEAADDEVGIYEVHEVDVEVIEIPEPQTPDGADTADADAAGADADDGAATGAVTGADDASTGEDADDAEAGVAPDAEADLAGDPSAGESPSGGEPESQSGGESGPAAGGESTAPDDRPAGTAATDGAEEPADADASAGAPETATEPSETATGTTVEESAVATDPESADGAAGRPDDEPTAAERERARKRAKDAEPTDAVAGSESDPFSAEEEWRETRSIPSLDPGEAGNRSAGTAASRESGRSRPGSGPPEGSNRGPRQTNRGRSRDRDGSSRDGDGSTDSSASSGDGAELRQELERVEAAREEARGELSRVRDQLEEAEGLVADLRAENERLEERAAELESRLADATTAGGSTAAGETGRSLSPDRALSGTNLFVRYDTKGGATLEKAHVGRAAPDDVNANLRLEQHTEFDDAGVSVGGEPFADFLEGTIEYGFVRWVVCDLLYEIRDTGNEGAMRDLFDAIPNVDRAELHGAVELVDEEGKKSGERTFDVVLRDRMGEPLVVADVTDSREATTESMIDDLVGDASEVAGQADELAAAFHVTASYFEPGALEAVADATGGGLLSRSARKSFVKLGRKQGFHLCLVESRDGEFHVNVPEL